MSPLSYSLELISVRTLKKDVMSSQSNKPIPYGYWPASSEDEIGFVLQELPGDMQRELKRSYQVHCIIDRLKVLIEMFAGQLLKVVT